MSYEISPAGVVTVKGTTRFKKQPEKFLAAMITPAIVKVNRDNLLALKKLLESEPARP